MRAAEDKTIILMHQLQERILKLNPGSSAITKVLESALKDNNIRAVSYYNGSMKLIYHSGARMYTVRTSKLKLRDQFSILTTPESLRIRLPLFFEPSRPDIKSWLEVEYSTSIIERDWYKSLSLTIFLVILIIIIFLTILWPTTNHILEHLYYLKKYIINVQSGCYDLDTKDIAVNEIQVLFDEIIALGKIIKSTIISQKAAVEEATTHQAKTLNQLAEQNRKLDKARLDALEASKIKSQFLANISHEVRTPLNGILGYTGLLKKSGLNEEHEFYLMTIENCSYSLLNLINDLLDFSKMEAGKLELDETAFCLRSLVDEVLSILSLQAQQKGIELGALITPETPDNILGDPHRLRQILINLIGNAIKFTHQGSVHLRVFVDDQAKTCNSHWMLKFSVTDTGIGLTSQQQKRLFEAFSQADTSVTRQYGGTGLGLVITKHLVECMNGNIRLESVPNEGSTFWFTAQFGINTAGDITKPSLPNLKIALCEPSTFTRKAIVQRLHIWDLEIREYSNLFELSNSKRDHDIVLYGLKGLEPSPIEQEVIRGLRINKTHVIAMTASNEQVYNKDLKKLGIEKFLPKPIHFKHLEDTLKSLTYDHAPLIEKAPSRSPEEYILAVDDNLANLRLLESLLKQNNLPTITAQSGIEALTLLKKYKVNTVLMDIQMPGMDGIETTKKIRCTKDISQIPIIALTAHALPNEKRNILASGIDDYLSKPINEAELLETLSKWSNFKSNTNQLEFNHHTNADQPPVIFDEQLCLQRSNNIRELAEDLVQGIKTELVQYMKLSKDLITSKDYESLLSSTHRLHGSLKYSGFSELELGIAQFETALKTGADQELLYEHFKVVETAGERVMECFEKNQLDSFSYIVTPPASKKETANTYENNTYENETP